MQATSQTHRRITRHGGSITGSKLHYKQIALYFLFGIIQHNVIEIGLLFPGFR